MSPEERERVRSLAREVRARNGWTQAEMGRALGVGPRMVRKLEAGTSGVSHLPALEAMSEHRYRDAAQAAHERQSSGRARAARAPIVVDHDSGQLFGAGQAAADELAERVRSGQGRTGGVAITFDYVDNTGRQRTGTLYDGWKGPAGADADWIAAELEAAGSLDAFIAEHAADSYGVSGGSVSGVTVTAV